MEQIIITRKDGATTYPLVSRQSFRTITSAKQIFQLLGKDVVKLTVESGDAVQFAIGDHFMMFGRLYTLNRLPEMVKNGEFNYSYTAEFEGVAYEMTRAIYELTVDTTNNQLQDVQGDSLTGNLKRFADVLIANLNRIFPNTWVLGTYPSTTPDDVTMTFGESDNCLLVAQNLCEKFEVEMAIAYNATTGIRTVNFANKVGTTTQYVFKYGRGRGLYSLNRQNVDTTNVITRLKAYGSTENITSKYRANRLCLPNTSKALSYLEDATAIANYGLFEACKFFDDIKPTFDGTVTAIDANDVLKFTDTSMFDLNERDSQNNTKYLLAGTPAKIHFNSGNLAGYEFEIKEYNHTTHTFTLKAIRDEYDRLFPSTESAAFKIAVGDTYKILDVTLPDTYIADAESRLADAAQDYFDDHKQPRVKYALSITRTYLERLFPGSSVIVNVFDVGDYIRVVDDKIGVDKLVRVISFERDVLNPYVYDITLSDTHEQSFAATILDDIVHHDKEIRTTKTDNIKSVRQAWRANRELMDATFDDDGHYYSEKIKPLSIDTRHLSVGAKWAQFTLINGVFSPNVNGNPASFAAAACVLAHYAIDDTQVVTWNMAAYTATLTDNRFYYLYAKCAKSGNTGQFLLSQTQYMASGDATYYYFLVGILHGVDSTTNTRMLSLSYGFSMINGRFITTGRIQSADGNTYFDLDDGEIGGKILFTRSGQGMTLQSLGDESSQTKDYIDNTLPGILDDIQAQLDGQIEQFFEAYDPTTSNAPASTWTTQQLKENHLGDLFYNTDNGKVFRWIKEQSGGVYTYSWQQLSDAEVAQALALANDALALARTKRRIFTATPTTPYEVGDLWVQGATGDIMRCTTERLTGNYSANDWEKASKYTDDTSLNAFINGLYDDDITALNQRLDGKIESWFQSTDPSTNWSSDEKALHVGDLWYNTTAKQLKRYVYENSAYSWQTIEDEKAIAAYANAATAQDTADCKRRVFVSQPSAPYDAGDLWLNNGKLYRSTTNRTTGYYSQDWIEAVEYTSDASLNDFIANAYANTISEIYAGIDGKIESWFTTSDPSSSWTNTDTKNKHVGDLWYNSTTKLLKRYTKSGSTFSWSTIEDAKAISAYDLASTAKDVADGKRRVFVVQPYAPYDVGDLWVDGTNLRRCITAIVAGQNYNANHWVIPVNYDNTKTVIDGGIVTSGTVQLAGDDQSIKAGVTGNGTTDESVRIWAGASFENRATAPFQVKQSGELKATNAHIEGYVKATSGEFKGKVEANEGRFFGSIATPPKTISNSSGAVTLSFATGFNFTAHPSSVIYKTVKLPTDLDYAGVECSIINTYNGTSALIYKGYLVIKPVNELSFMYSSGVNTLETVNEIYLYGVGQLKLKAIVVNNQLRWFVENHNDFCLDIVNHRFRNDKPNPLARCVGMYEIGSSVSSMSTVFCNDGNTLTMNHDDTGKWSFTWSQERSSKKKYVILPYGFTAPGTIFSYNITGTGFQIASGCVFGTYFNYTDSTNWGFCVYEFDK